MDTSKNINISISKQVTPLQLKWLKLSSLLAIKSQFPIQANDTSQKVIVKAIDPFNKQNFS